MDSIAGNRDCGASRLQIQYKQSSDWSFDSLGEEFDSNRLIFLDMHGKVLIELHKSRKKGLNVYYLLTLVCGIAEHRRKFCDKIGFHRELFR